MATFLQHLAHSNDSKRSHTLASPALLSPSNVSILQRKPNKMPSRKCQFVKDHFCVSVMPCCCVLHNNTSMILFMHQLKTRKEIDAQLVKHYLKVTVASPLKLFRPNIFGCGNVSASLLYQKYCPRNRQITLLSIHQHQPFKNIKNSSTFGINLVF